MKRQFRWILILSVLVVMVLGFLFPNQNPHFWWQEIPIFDSLLGFLGCIAIVFFSKWLGNILLMKDEDYYD